MEITSKDFEKLKPGEEIVIYESHGSPVTAILVCRNSNENSLIMDNGLAIIHTVVVTKTGRRFHEFSLSPKIYSYLAQNKMLVTKMGEVHVGDCILVSTDDFKTVHAYTVAVYDPGRDIAFDIDGTPIDLRKMRVAKAGFKEDMTMVSTKGNHLLSDCIVSD